MPCRSMSPSTVDSTECSVTPRAAAMLANPAEASGQADEDEFNWRGAIVLAGEYDRMVGIEVEGGHVGHLLAGAVEAADRAAAVRTAHPGIGRAELEPREIALLLHRVDRGEERCGVNTVAGGGFGSGHCGGCPL